MKKLLTLAIAAALPSCLPLQPEPHWPPSPPPVHHSDGLKQVTDPNGSRGL
jgi:hypothetical protein